MAYFDFLEGITDSVKSAEEQARLAAALGKGYKQPVKPGQQPPKDTPKPRENWVTNLAMGIGDLSAKALRSTGEQVGKAGLSAHGVTKDAALNLMDSPLNDPAQVIAASEVESQAKATKATLEAEKVRQQVLQMQREAAANEPKPPPEMPGLQMNQPGETVLGAAKTAGIPEQDFQAAILEMGKKMGINLDEPVQFPLAFQRLLNEPDFADVRPDFEALGAPPPQQQPQQTSGKPGEAGQQMASTPDLHAEEREILTRLAQSQQWNWYEVIAFVLLSMTIKPAATIMLWNRNSTAGTIKAELQENRRKQKMEEEMNRERIAIEKERRGYAAQLRRDAVMEGLRHTSRMDVERERFRNDWLQMVYKAANTRKRAEEDPDLKVMQKDVEMYLDFAAKASAAFDHDEAKKYLQRADNAMKIMLKYRAGELDE